MRRLAIGVLALLAPVWCLGQETRPRVAVPPVSVVAPSVVVMPYVQPGPLAPWEGYESRRIHWLTTRTPAEFVVEFELPDGTMRTARPTVTVLDFAAFKKVESPAKKEVKKAPAAKKDAKPSPEKPPRKKRVLAVPLDAEQHYLKYTAALDYLPVNAAIRYRVKEGPILVREAVFRTTAAADRPVRCVLVGDMAQGGQQQQEIAYRISQERPEFLVALGDIVYSSGRVCEYINNYWDTYSNAGQPHPQSGAPLMASVTFYPVVGNHDIGARLATVPDALGVYYFFSPPQNGPGAGPWVTPLDGSETAIAKFRAAAKDSYPFADTYSFDNGAAHFVVINVNPKMDLKAPRLQQWLKDDLSRAKDRWKFVCYHMPAFHSSKQHYAEQQVRVLNPLFEKLGVTMTLAGHVHNYQRSVPIRFEPAAKPGKKYLVNGRFTLDKVFDGVKATQPAGVIHIVAGGGGAGLYGPGLDKTAAPLRKQYGDNYADFTAKTVVDKHSFVVLDIAPDRVLLRALSVTGQELDRISVTKGK